MIAPTPTPEALRAQRRRAGLTQEQAAERLGVSRRSIAGWETGERELQYDYSSVDFDGVTYWVR